MTSVRSFVLLKIKEIDPWIHIDVINVCERPGLPKERIMSMRWIHTWKVSEETGETKAKASCREKTSLTLI